MIEDNYDYTQLDLISIQNALDKLLEARDYLESGQKKFWNEETQTGAYIVDGNQIAVEQFKNSFEKLDAAIGNLMYIIGKATEQHQANRTDEHYRQKYSEMRL